MRIIIATTAPLYWQPQAECFASAWRQAGHDAVAVNVQTLDTVRQAPANLLVCLGSGESVQPFLDANLAQRRILFLIESLPTLDEADDFTRGKLAAHRGTLGERKRDITDS